MLMQVFCLATSIDFQIRATRPGLSTRQAFQESMFLSHKTVRRAIFMYGGENLSSELSTGPNNLLDLSQPQAFQKNVSIAQDRTTVQSSCILAKTCHRRGCDTIPLVTTPVAASSVKNRVSIP